MTPAQPARIHLLPAAKAPVVVVIRRKPSKQFHIIRVDTVTGKAEHGAWFNGKLYPGRASAHASERLGLRAAMPLDDIKNFLTIDARVGTAGQPTEAELAEVAAGGYQAVVNLGLLNPEYCLPDEAGLAASLGMKYRHLPVNFDAPAVADFEAFVAQMDAWGGERVFVHCAANFRVSSFMAVYGEMRLGWDRDRADRHARTFWEPNRTWQAFVDDCRAQFLERR